MANSISGVAQGISMLAVPWYFTGIIGQPGLFAKCYLLITGVSMFWGIYAGSLIDRYDRKNIFLAINTSGLLALLLVSLYGYHTGDLNWIAVVSVFGVTAFIYNIHFPNLYAFAQEITPRANYARITSLLEIQGQLTFTIAGGLAAALLQGFDGIVHFAGHDYTMPFSIKAWSIQQIFLANAITYAITLVLIWRIRSIPVLEKKVDRSPLKVRLKTGFHFLKKHPLILDFGNTSLLLFLTILVFGTYVSPVYVKNFLHADAGAYAVSDMTFSLGSLMAGFLTNRIFGEKNTIKGIVVLSLTAALMYFLMAVNRELLLFYFFNFVIGACNASVRIQRVTYLFNHIPNAIIGRANSIFFVINVFLRLCLIGLFNLPFFLEGAQIVYAVGIMGIICLAMAGLLAINYKRLIKAPMLQESNN